MSAHLLDLLAREMSRLLDPLLGAVDNPHAFERLLIELGAQPDALGSDRDKVMAALTAVSGLQEQTEALMAQPSLSLQTLSELLDLCDQAFVAVRALNGLGAAPDVFAELGEDLTAYLLAVYLDHWHPLSHRLAVLATLIEPSHEQETRLPAVRDDMVVRYAVNFDRFRFGRLADLVRDPVATLRAEYGTVTGTIEEAQKLERKFFPRLQRVLRILGVPCRYGFDPDAAEGLGEAAPFLEHALIVYVDDVLAGAPAEAGVILNISPADRGDLGLVVSPFGTLTTTKQAGAWLVEISLTGDVEVLAYGRHGLTLLADAATAQVQAGIRATLPVPDDQPAFVLGAPTGSRLEIAGAQFTLDTSLSEAEQSLALAADIKTAAIVIAPGDGDGFLADILPAQGLRANFDLGLAWSNDKGLTLRGSAGLEETLPVGLSVAGVSLSTVHLSLQAHDDHVSAEVSASLSASIGPVRAVLDRVGIAGALSFPQTGGNLGVADLDLGFKPPSGVGLSVDAQGVVTGGGFLFHDATQQLYAGVMQLSLNDQLTVTAFGLIATRMPDGSPGYSLLIFITAEDFRPIPLGMGFTLQGIGGMVAVNRTFDQDVLRESLKNGTLGALLFPRDPVANAPAIVRALASAFPARRGSYLLGILAKIGWLTPTLIQLDLALILEFGARRRLLVLGRISSLLPSRDNDLVRINLDAMGVLDFDQGTASIDAVLVDSRLAHKFALTGAAALRAGWGSGPDAGFVLAVGGFNPRFAPPAGVPPLARVAIALSSGTNPRLTCDAYFAITANTIQFGARAQLYAEAYSFSISGDVGYDVLIARAPLHFIADFHASVQLKHGSHNLFKVAVEGTLEGPRPLRLSGKATFEIFWCDFSVRFDKNLIDGEPPPPPPAIDVLAELTRALSTAQSWRTQPPAGRTHGVALRKLAPGTALVLDPLGRLAVTQDVVPLNTGRDIDIFSGAPVAGARRFALAATLNNVNLTQMTALQAPFAPAQFFDMSDDEKLASPSFQEMDAGLVVGSDAVSFDPNQLVAAPVEYDSIVIDSLAAADSPLPPATRYVLPALRLEMHAASGAAARAPVRRVGRARFRTTAPAAVHLAQPAWAIVPLEAGLPVTLDPSIKTWSEYRSALATLNRGGARFQLVPARELAH